MTRDAPDGARCPPPEHDDAEGNRPLWEVRSVTAPVDIRQLAVRRDGPPEPARRRHLLARYLLPAAILLGFAALAAWSASDLIRPAKPVTVVPVLTTRAELAVEGGAPLFQAAGWVEPRPTPVLVTALTDGVVERLLVVEGQEVKAGEPVAELVRADAELALAAAEADWQTREAEAESLTAQAATALTFLPFQVQAAEARQKLARV